MTVFLEIDCPIAKTKYVEIQVRVNHYFLRTIFIHFEKSKSIHKNDMIGATLNLKQTYTIWNGSSWHTVIKNWWRKKRKRIFFSLASFFLIFCTIAVYICHSDQKGCCHGSAWSNSRNVSSSLFDQCVTQWSFYSAHTLINNRNRRKKLVVLNYIA